MLIDLKTGLELLRNDAVLNRDATAGPSPLTDITGAVKIAMSPFDASFAATQYGQLILQAMAFNGSLAVDAYAGRRNKHDVRHEIKEKNLELFRTVAIAQATLLQAAKTFETNIENYLAAFEDLVAKRDQAITLTEQIQKIAEETGHIPLIKGTTTLRGAVSGLPDEQQLHSLQTIFAQYQQAIAAYEEDPSAEKAEILQQIQTSILNEVEAISAKVTPAIEAMQSLKATIAEIKSAAEAGDLKAQATLGKMEEMDGFITQLEGTFGSYITLQEQLKNGELQSPEEINKLVKATAESLGVITNILPVLAAKNSEGKELNEYELSLLTQLKSHLEDFHNDPELQSLTQELLKLYEDTEIAGMKEQYEATLTALSEANADVKEAEQALANVETSIAQAQAVDAVLSELETSRSTFIAAQFGGKVAFHKMNAADTIFWGDNFKGKPEVHVTTAEGNVVFEKDGTYYYYPENDPEAEIVEITDPAEITNIMHQAWVGDPENGIDPKPFGNETAYKHAFEGWGLKASLLGGQSQEESQASLASAQNAASQQLAERLLAQGNAQETLASAKSEAEALVAKSEALGGQLAWGNHILGNGCDPGSTSAAFNASVENNPETLTPPLTSASPEPETEQPRAASPNTGTTVGVA